MPPGYKYCCFSITKSVRLFTASWTAWCQAPLSFTISQPLFKLMFTELVMLSNHLILCHTFPLLPSIFSSIRAFSNESATESGASVSASVLPMNTQGWFPLGLTGLISLQSKGLSRVFPRISIWRHQFFAAHSSEQQHTSVQKLLEKKHSFGYTDQLEALVVKLKTRKQAIHAKGDDLNIVSVKTKRWHSAVCVYGEQWLWLNLDLCNRALNSLLHKGVEVPLSQIRA